MTGLLDQVDLQLARAPATTAPLIAQIRTVAADGCPSDTILASESVAAAEVLTSFETFAIRFSSPASVTAGNEYALVFFTAQASLYSAKSEAVTNPYAAGQHCFSLASPPLSWTPATDNDFLFRTYVVVEGQEQVPPPPDPPPLSPVKEPAPLPPGQDTASPETTITKKPTKKHRRSSIVRFESSEPGSTFTCILDGSDGHDCVSPTNYKDLARGRHHLLVAATDAAGNTDPSPAETRFFLKKKR